MSEPKKGDVIAVWFSCGAASAVALKKTIEKYGGYCTIRAINNPVKEEDSDNRRFMRDVSDWLGIEIESATNPDWPDNSCVTVWGERKFMSSPYGAPCTGELKKKARQHWESNNKHDWLVMGFTTDEKHRSDKFRMTERENLIPILVDSGTTKADCFLEIMEAGISLPRIYRQGYPNANCIGCVKANSSTYWNHVRKQHPEVFQQRAEQSREIGAKLVRVKGKRIFLDELDENATGRPMKNLDFECGIFCEER